MSGLRSPCRATQRHSQIRAVPRMQFARKATRDKMDSAANYRRIKADPGACAARRAKITPGGRKTPAVLTGDRRSFVQRG